MRKEAREREEGRRERGRRERNERKERKCLVGRDIPPPKEAQLLLPNSLLDSTLHEFDLLVTKKDISFLLTSYTSSMLSTTAGTWLLSTIFILQPIFLRRQGIYNPALSLFQCLYYGTCSKCNSQIKPPLW